MPVRVHDGLRTEAADAEHEKNALDDFHGPAFPRPEEDRGAGVAATRMSELPINAIAGGDPAGLRLIAFVAAGRTLGRLVGGGLRRRGIGLRLRRI